MTSPQEDTAVTHSTASDNTAPDSITTGSTTSGGTVTRSNVMFSSGDGVCAGWLYLPEQHPEQALPPVIVMAHGLGGVKEMRLDAFAERFSAEGYACLVFDYRHFGGSTGNPRQLLDRHQELDDWAAAIAYARSLVQVDANRVALWGTSFGGGLVLHAAANDGDIAAVISQCPFTDGFASAKGASLSSSVKVMTKALTDVVGSKIGLAMIPVDSAGRPGSAALMNSFDSYDGYLALTDGVTAFRNFVGARFALQISRYFPGRYAQQLGCPVYVAVCAYDTVAPPAATVRHTQRAAHSQVVTYPLGHFDVYLGDGFEQVVTDYIRFLHEQLPIH